MTESRYATVSEVELHYLEDGKGDVDARVGSQTHRLTRSSTIGEK